MDDSKKEISRPTVGFCALFCLIAAGVLKWVTPEMDPNQLGQAAFTRVGLVMSAFWLALPSRRREAAWAGISPRTIFAIVFALFLVARFKQAVIPVLIGVAAVGYFIRPRGKERPRDRPG